MIAVKTFGLGVTRERKLGLQGLKKLCHQGLIIFKLPPRSLGKKPIIKVFLFLHNSELILQKESVSSGCFSKAISSNYLTLQLPETMISLGFNKYLTKI